MTGEHERLRTALGAYVVGALPPAERAEVEEHLHGCPACREELAELAVLPGLLGRLTDEEVTAVPPRPPARVVEAAVAAIAASRRAERRRVRRWQLAAATLAVVGVVVLIPVLDAPDGPAATLAPASVAADAGEVTGTVTVVATGWGMQVEVDLRRLPARRGYTLVVVTDDDHRTTAASWTATPDGAVRLRGSCYVMVDDLDRLEVVAPDDEVLVVFEA